MTKSKMDLTEKTHSRSETAFSQGRGAADEVVRAISRFSSDFPPRKLESIWTKTGRFAIVPAPTGFTLEARDCWSFRPSLYGAAFVTAPGSLSLHCESPERENEEKEDEVAARFDVRCGGLPDNCRFLDGCR